MDSNIIGIYLAAGKSSRFGSDKLTHHVKGKPLGAHGLRTALQSDLRKVTVMTKDKNVPWLHPFLNHTKCEQLTCRQAYLGQAQSIKCGLHDADLQHAEAIMVILADQPFITTNMLQTLIDVYEKQKNLSFVAAHHNGVICPPILISRSMFSDVYQLEGDRGAKSLLLKKASQGTFIPFTNEQLFYDVDTREDYREISH